MFTKILNSKTMNEYDPAGTVVPCRVIFFFGEGAEDLTDTIQDGWLWKTKFLK